MERAEKLRMTCEGVITALGIDTGDIPSLADDVAAIEKHLIGLCFDKAKGEGQAKRNKASNHALLILLCVRSWLLLHSDNVEVVKEYKIADEITMETVLETINEAYGPPVPGQATH